VRKILVPPQRPSKDDTFNQTREMRVVLKMLFFSIIIIIIQIQLQQIKNKNKKQDKENYFFIFGPDKD